MSNFKLLCEPVQQNIVNTLGWNTLMPLQDMAIPPLLNREHGLLLAPTAGGKTESGIFPILTRAHNERWEPLSILYISPIKALLNNLHPRLTKYAGWLGATVGVWHGDVHKTQKLAMQSSPPDILLTTPESLEVMLTSKSVDPKVLLGRVKVVITDEIHAFAGDDRGWHLLSVVDRVQALSGEPIQRIGYSATVGNPETILSWLTSGCEHKGSVISPPITAPPTEPHIQIDYVQSLTNAATVISRMHVGKKRLVFCDSRSRSEKLASDLRSLGVTTFVSHSSLSAEERNRAEEAFAEARNCVIVATSTLELGIDVGDLDICIQIDSPNTVASFLQRLGRTGRRKGSAKNCLFLATSTEALVRAISIVNLWKNGFVEPVVPAPLPYPVAAQQIMALSLQRGDKGRTTWPNYLPSLINGGSISEADIRKLTDHMCENGYLDKDDRMLSIGITAEKRYSFKNWMALFTVFTAAPMYSVYNGRTELGSVHLVTFSSKNDGRPITLSLAGRSWLVRSVNHKQQKAYVEPSKDRSSSLWLSSAPGLPFGLCQAIKSTLCGDKPLIKLSDRSTIAMDEIYIEYDWLLMESTTLMLDGSNATWWTYGGALLNAAITARLPQQYTKVSSDSFSIKFKEVESLTNLFEDIDTIMKVPAADMTPYIDDEVLDEIKFLECVPQELKTKFINARFSCTDAWKLIQSQPITRVQHQ